MDDFKGRTAVVTGAGSGIGRSIALALAREGVNVVVSDIEEANARKVSDEVIALGARSIAVKTDVASLEQVQALANAAYAEFGDVDILCNNAGVAFRPFRAIWDTSYADFQWMLGVNIWGVIHGIHVFLPKMRAKAGTKHIVNTSSISTLFTVPGNATYTMTKCAIDGLSQVIREELTADNIGVTVLYPGHVKTNVSNSARLRPEAEQAANRLVRSYDSYAEERGQAPKGQAAGVAGGGVHLIGAGEIARPIEAEEVGPMVIDAIRHNRLYCMTHPAPREGIEARTSELLESYRPVR
jgi:NAD(P)-dependent dehydrogenase (short-subunit alcohol dehydrogenase family)